MLGWLASFFIVIAAEFTSKMRMYTVAVRQTHDGQTEMDRQTHDRADRGGQTDTRRIDVDRLTSNKGRQTHRKKTDRHTSNRGRQIHGEKTEVDTPPTEADRQTDTREKAEVDTQTHDGRTDRQTDRADLACLPHDLRVGME